VRVIAKRSLRLFWGGDKRHADARAPLEAWYREAVQATWPTPAAIKAQFRSASILRGGRVVFNIAGNKYRLVVWIRYVSHTVHIRFIARYEEYDEIDPQTI
jgi:mRNA interferase HigB